MTAQPGAILPVDLGAGPQGLGSIGSPDRPAPRIVDRVLLGRGYNAYRLLELVGSGTDPLSPENPLLLTCGLLTGTAAPTAARLHVSARSPQTGLIGSSSVGGKVGPGLRSLGLHGLEISGASAEPVYLYLDGESSELRPAGHLWGLETPDTAATLAREVGAPDAVMLIIGPAGERQVPISCVVTQRGHAAGRTGMGAVMGSKRLKAIVIRPGKGRSPSDGSVREAVKAYLRSIKSADGYEAAAKHGTSSGIGWADERGLLATENYGRGTFAGAEAIDGAGMDRYVRTFRACRGCPVHCKAELAIEGRGRKGELMDRPDFEPLASWGSKTGLADVEAVVWLHHLCDRLGLDSVTAGNAVAFAIDLFERGILSPEDTGGLELRWGDEAVMETLVRQIARAEGFGAVLGKGVREAARLIGRGAEAHAAHVKGLEITAQDPRGAFATGLGYAVSNRGADFTNVYARHDYTLTPEEATELYGRPEAADRFSTVGKADMVKRSMSVCAALDAIGICKMPALTLINAYDLELEARLVSTITGRELSGGELLEVGERILHLERLLNFRLGATAADDRLPDFFAEQPLPEGPSAGHTIDVQPMVREFYEAMGWDASGSPTPERLRDLGLSELIHPTEPHCSQEVPRC